MSNPTPPPGWHPDPHVPGQQRYWDGAQWTENTAPGAPAGPAFQQPMNLGQAIPGEKPQQNWFLRHKILSGVLALFVIGVIASAAGGGGSSDDGDKTGAVSDSSSSAKSEPNKASESEAEEPKADEPVDAPEPAKKVIKVKAAKILQEFEDNEAAADLKYGNHQLLEITGYVSKVDTELLHDDRYVIRVAGPDYDYTFTSINCDGQSAQDVASIQVGQKITIGGDFQDGGDLGIELGGCHVIR